MQVSLPDFHLAILPYGVPETPDQALFSAPWCAAVALATGKCTSDDFTAAGIARADIRALTARTTATGRTPKDRQINLDPNDPDVVTVTMKDGRTETARVDLWTGAPGRDMDRDQLMAKFRENCARAGVDDAVSAKLAECITKLSDAGSMNDLMQAFSDIAAP